MNIVQFVQQFEPMELGYRESKRLEANVAREFHKNIASKRYLGSTSGSGVSTSASIYFGGFPRNVGGIVCREYVFYKSYLPFHAIYLFLLI